MPDVLDVQLHPPPGPGRLLGSAPGKLVVLREDLLPLAGGGTKVRDRSASRAHSRRARRRRAARGRRRRLGRDHGRARHRSRRRPVLGVDCGAVPDVGSTVAGLLATTAPTAGLLAVADAGAVEPTDTTVLLHTGGVPGLFAHPEADHLVE